jgi:hypothetical protein
MLCPSSRSACNDDDLSNGNVLYTTELLFMYHTYTTLFHDDIHHTTTTHDQKKTTVHPTHSPRSRNDNYNFTLPHCFPSDQFVVPRRALQRRPAYQEKSKIILFIIISYFTFLFSCRGDHHGAFV